MHTRMTYPPLYKNFKNFHEFELVFKAWVSLNIDDNRVTDANWKAPLILSAKGHTKFLYHADSVCSYASVQVFQPRYRLGVAINVIKREMYLRKCIIYSVILGLFLLCVYLCFFFNYKYENYWNKNYYNYKNTSFLQ
eukprot:GHVR01128857.1.p1 GENE.GHVR01128857.1~~GHVR01128857.1.p1  ORF type:complete len:137 (+),score=5.97 GHVR01128857.1:129-539(+)